MQEGEDIKEEVWTQLGRFEGHTNVVSSNLIHLYTPVEVAEESGDLEEDGERVLGDPQTKLPNWPLVPNKSNHRWSVYAIPRKATTRSKQVRDYVTEVVTVAHKQIRREIYKQIRRGVHKQIRTGAYRNIRTGEYKQIK